MALNTLGEPLEHGLAVGPAVTLGAGQDLAVPGMTLGTGKGTVLGNSLLQMIVLRVVTGTAHLVGRIPRVGDTGGRMDRVTDQTVGHLLALDVGLMTVATLGYITVSVGMTAVTPHFGVFTGILFKLLHRLRMTFNTLTPYGPHGDFLGSMGINMAGLAPLHTGSVGKLVAAVALGHDLGPVLLNRAIHMVLLVALGTQKPLVLTP